MQLTDTALVLLSTASRREDHGVELPAKLKGAAAIKVLGTLRKAGLIEEVRARGLLSIWRRDDDERPMALRITKAGLRAIRVEIGQDDATDAASKHVVRNSPSNKRNTALQSSPLMPPKADSKRVAVTPAPTNRVRSKQAQVIEMLRRPEGVTVPAIMQVTGWQQHSIRGFFAGAVRRRLGLTLVSEVIDGSRVYRVLREGSDRSLQAGKTRKAA